MSDVQEYIGEELQRFTDEIVEFLSAAYEFSKQGLLATGQRIQNDLGLLINAANYLLHRLRVLGVDQGSQAQRRPGNEVDRLPNPVQSVAQQLRSRLLFAPRRTRPPVQFGKCRAEFRGTSHQAGLPR